MNRAPRFDAAGHYLHWGVVQISLTNLAIILIMLAVFVAAVLVPFPAHRRGDDAEAGTDDERRSER